MLFLTSAVIFLRSLGTVESYGLALKAVISEPKLYKKNSSDQQMGIKWKFLTFFWCAFLVKFNWKTFLSNRKRIFFGVVISVAFDITTRIKKAKFTRERKKNTHLLKKAKKKEILKYFFCIHPKSNWIILKRNKIIHIHTHRHTLDFYVNISRLSFLI